MANISLYNTIYEQTSQLKCSRDQLEAIKLRYNTEINSKRRSEAVDSLPKLMCILKKRDCLHTENIGPLQEIAITLHDEAISKLCHQYFQKEQPKVAVGLPSVAKDIKQRVYDLIAQEIGSKWHNFARALEVREGQIDNLRAKYLNDTQGRVYDILRYHEENCDKRVWRTNLLEALTKARRNDLRQKIQNIYDTY